MSRQIIEADGGAPEGRLPVLSPQVLQEVGDTLTQALLFSLERNFLEGAVLDNRTLQYVSGGDLRPLDAAFLEITQIGRSVDGDPAQYARAIQTTLAAGHDARYRLIFFIHSDGRTSRIFLGVAGRTAESQPQLFAEQLGQFLSSNWPGTRVSSVQSMEPVAEHLHRPLSEYRFSRALTGVPSEQRVTGSSQPQRSIDTLIRGLRGKPYLYLVMADPMEPEDVDEIIDACRTLSGQVHALTRISLARSRSEGRSTSQTQSESETESKSVSSSEAQTTSESASKGGLSTAMKEADGRSKALKGVGLGALSALVVAAGGPFLLSGMMGLFGQLLPSSTGASSLSKSRTESETASRTSGRSTTSGASSGSSLSFSQEYLNKRAEISERLLDGTAARFERAKREGSWNVGVYLITDQPEMAALSQAQLKALVSGNEQSPEPIRAHDLEGIWDGQVQAALDGHHFPAMQLAGVEGDALRHPLGRYFESLTTPLNTGELAFYANLPTRELPGIPFQPTAGFSLNPPRPHDPENAFDLGSVLEGGEAVPGISYQVDVDSLTRHIFTTGITGSGKSNTCRHLLDNLLVRDVPFLVLEPAKDEYVQLALAFNQSGKYKSKIGIYMPGRREWGGHALDEMQLNPFDIVRITGAATQVMPHLDRLKSIFNASFPMYEVLPIILEEALVDLYDSQGWLGETLPGPDIGRPTLEILHRRIGKLVRDKGYEARISANITAALRTRIGSLLRGWKGRMFDTPVSTPWDQLYDRPVVINLSQMGDDADKAFTMGLLLNFMYEYRQAQHEAAGSPESSHLRHLTLVEEAHRVLRRAGGGGGTGSPQAKMGEMFADVLAEIRAYGQGLAIIDQIPAKLVPDAIKNTNLRIIHRLVAADDRETMASALALSEEQARVIARLKVGQAIVSGIQDDLAAWVQIPYSPIPELEA